MITPPLVWIVVGARPNFMKAAPVLLALRRRGRLDAELIHTGQHYDERMSERFLRDLGLPTPDVNLDARSGTHAEQTAQVMLRFERHLAEARRRPRAVVVVGDVNSTLACALVAAKAGVFLAHVEAGLRSFDRGMPEEVNRVCVDQLADLCFVTEGAGLVNLAREGKEPEACLLVGNTMIDTLLAHRERARQPGRDLCARLGLSPGGYTVCTLHRPNNVDEPGALARLLTALERLAARRPLIWPVHPRTLARVTAFGLGERLAAIAGLRLLEPLGYLEFLGLMDHAALVLTDSGGIQEEACVLKLPCVTVRPCTERPATLEMGGNVLCGPEADAILAATLAMEGADRVAIGTPPLWDGHAGERIAGHLESRLAAPAATPSLEGCR